MKILTLNAEIGLGHSYYLDVFIAACRRLSPEAEIYYYNVLQTRKFFSRMFWKLSEFLYYWGSQGGEVTKIYNKIRQSSKGIKVPVDSINFSEYHRIVVAHPLLAKTLKNVYYLHGEVALPRECIIKDVQKIIVPLESERKLLIDNHLLPSQIIVSGLIIPLNLLETAEQAFALRLKRLKNASSLKVGFFVSGAYPRAHIEKIILGILSILKNGHRAFLFAGTNKKRSEKIIQKLNKYLKLQNIPSPTIVIIQNSKRAYYQSRINELLPALDLMVAPAHEHTNWALGLGLPIFCLFPMIGSYACTNYKYLLEAQVVYPLRTNLCARSLGSIIDNLRKDGRLIAMAKNGFNRYSINGALKSAEAVLY
ncbi:MAG: hypothetical protein N2166_00035 [candidate division WOR-3 bacterium]|nr:hypothetical protein [candidate division WOR-3 bacterium]